MSSTPWQRVRKPMAPPARPDATALLALSQDDFALLLRSNLLPPAQGDRRGWDALWKSLREDDDLADRALDVLEDFLDEVEAALERSDLAPDERKRASKFRTNAQSAWARIDRPQRPAPLAWMGPDAEQFSEPSRRVIASLVGAIAKHRNRTDVARPADEELWGILSHLGVDPRDFN